jgi:type 1 glutamine amidotransferase
VLTYTQTFAGTLIPTVLILTPDGTGLNADFSLLDGQFEMSGTGTKGISAPSSARPATPTPTGGAPAGRPAQPQVARVTDLLQMMSALPESAPATPKQPRKVLVLARAAGFVHASIPLAARTIEALGQKTGAWTTVITYDAADINTDNLRQYDAIFLASTTGLFLDDPNDQSATTARRNAMLEFVRSGKGLAGIHAATDSYHGAAASPAGAAASRAVDGGSPLWPAFNTLIGGYFKFHWIYPTQIAVKIDDPDNPINAPFTSLHQPSGVRLPRPFSIVDEVYTFNQNSWSRSNAHVLTSIDYAKMPPDVKALEPAPRRTDGDYALSYIRREGKGRVFVELLGHDESIYKLTPMLAHILAGLQYVLGDLQADDSPAIQATR